MAWRLLWLILAPVFADITDDVSAKELVSAVTSPPIVPEKLPPENMDAKMRNLYGMPNGAQCSNTNHPEALSKLLDVLVELLNFAPNTDKGKEILVFVKKNLETLPLNRETQLLTLKLNIIETKMSQNGVNTNTNAGIDAGANMRPMTTVVFKHSLPGIHQAQCQEEFGNLLQTAHDAYTGLSIFPNCRINELNNQTPLVPQDQRPFKIINVEASSHYPSQTQNRYYSSSLYNSPPMSNPKFKWPSLGQNYPTNPYYVNYLAQGSMNGLPTNPYFTNGLVQNGINNIDQQANPNKQLHHLYEKLFNSNSNVNVYTPHNIQSIGLNNLPSNLKPIPQIKPNALSESSIINSGNGISSSTNINVPLTSNTVLPTDNNFNAIIDNQVGSGKLENLSVEDNMKIQALPGSIDGVQSRHDLAKNSGGKLNPPVALQEDKIFVIGHQTGTLLHPLLQNNQVIGGAGEKIQLEQLPWQNQVIFKKPFGHNNNVGFTGNQLMPKSILPNVPFANNALNTEYSLSYNNMPIQLNQLNQNTIPYMSAHIPPEHWQNQNYKYYNQYYDNLVNNNEVSPDLKRVLAMSNANKLLTSPANKAGIVELTYRLKKSMPMIYQPYYYVKYRVPYSTFVDKFQNIVTNPALRGQRTNFHEELLKSSNMTDMPKDLRNYKENEILRLLVDDGALVDAKVVNGDDDPFNEQFKFGYSNIEETKRPEDLLSLNTSLLGKSLLLDKPRFSLKEQLRSLQNIEESKRPDDFLSLNTSLLGKSLLQDKPRFSLKEQLRALQNIEEFKRPEDLLSLNTSLLGKSLLSNEQFRFGYSNIHETKRPEDLLSLNTSLLGKSSVSGKPRFSLNEELRALQNIEETKRPEDLLSLNTSLLGMSSVSGKPRFSLNEELRALQNIEETKRPEDLLSLNTSLLGKSLLSNEQFRFGYSNIEETKRPEDFLSLNTSLLGKSSVSDRPRLSLNEQLRALQNIEENKRPEDLLSLNTSLLGKSLLKLSNEQFRYGYSNIEETKRPEDLLSLNTSLLGKSSVSDRPRLSLNEQLRALQNIEENKRPEDLLSLNTSLLGKSLLSNEQFRFGYSNIEETKRPEDLLSLNTSLLGKSSVSDRPRLSLNEQLRALQNIQETKPRFYFPDSNSVEPKVASPEMMNPHNGRRVIIAGRPGFPAAYGNTHINPYPYVVRRTLAFPKTFW